MQERSSSTLNRQAKIAIAIALAALSLAVGATVLSRLQSGKRTPTATGTDGRALLHNGWSLTPAGNAIPLPGDMPLAIVPITGTHYVLVNTGGYHDQSISVVDAETRKVVQSIVVQKAWLGLAYDPSRKEVFLSSGSPDPYRAKRSAAPGADMDYVTGIERFKWTGAELRPEPSLAILGLPAKHFISGILADGHGTLYIADIQNDTIYRLSGEELTTASSVKTGYRPYGLVLSPDGSTLAVSNWGDKSVTLFASTGTRLEPKDAIPVGVHPNAVAYGPDGRLFVANAGSNSVSVIRDGHVAETIRVGLGGDAKLGATPVALSVSANRLYVANADNNCVAVVDTSNPRSSKVLGFIPTGRYPSAVLADEGRLLVATAKGLSDAPNLPEASVERQLQTNPGQTPKSLKYTYVGDLLAGNLSFVDPPSADQLRAFTEQVRKNLPLGDSVTLTAGERRDILDNAFHQIHHVIYVIRENRTYDQVLGDVKEGDGDARLTLFGQKVTPNSHQLVHDFALFDNLYCDGEVSQVGHQWTDAAYANDYTEKQWILSYSGRGEVESDDRMFTSPGGYLWQNAIKHGRTSRIYGEYLQWQEDHNSAHGDVKANPEKYGCSAAFEKVFARGGRDPEKLDVFLDEMRAAEKTGVWPNFMVMALNEDHTSGSRPGRHTAQACVASNDLALGRLVDGVSHSKFWKDTAIFVIEDDAQDGPDHVDAHRTVGLVISPYIRRGSVDPTMYSTCSMIRTMELILGLPPMSQYDAGATAMYNCFTTKPDLSPYSALPPQIDVEAMNPETGELAERSMKLDFSDLDRADPQEFNSILWESIKPGVPMPAPVRSYWVRR